MRPARGAIPGVRTASLLLALPLLAACGARAPVLPLVPVPASARALEGERLVLDTASVIAVPAGNAEAARIARQLATVIGSTVETTPRVVEAGDPAASGAAITLALDPAAADRFGPEGYALAVAADGARIDAAEPAGLFYGTQTLRQLLPARVEYTAALPRRQSVPPVEIEDRPRYGWRGAMLDVSRHFFGVDDVKRLIDLMALHKLNRLHLHLSDDQGWRIEIPGWPRLTEHGGSSQVGGRGGGYYTSENYAEIVRYAAERYITIVPEIDMPGHTNAALASYPEQLTCDGVAPPLYTGTRVGFSALCDHEPTYAFVDAVVAHLASLTPGPWIHLGGDEVEEMTQEEYNRFVERVQGIVERHGKRLVGWQEIAAARLTPGTMVQHWRGSGETLAGAGEEQVILSPASRIYLDMRYHQETPIGLTWAGLNPLRDAYEWEPAELIPGLSPAAIAGLEAPLWTESVGTLSDIEFMAFPRLAAVAELAWSPREHTEWQDFRRRLAPFGRRWQALGVNFYRSPEVEWEGW